MKYEIRLPVGETIFPLELVASSIARAKATSHGKTDLHKHTYDNAYSRELSSLLAKAGSGQLLICDYMGNILSRDAIQPVPCDVHTIQYCTTIPLLNQSFAQLGVSFKEIEMPTIVKHYDLVDGNGETIEAEYFLATIGDGDADTINSEIGSQQENASLLRSVAGITKQKVINAFEGVYWERDKWGKYLGDPPEWLKECRVARGSKKASATWNPVLIAVALHDRGVPIKKLDAVFVGLKDWADKWQEDSALFR
jgi:hypothetical protein